MFPPRTTAPVLLALLGACRTTTGVIVTSSADDSHVPATERAAYDDDASRLALRAALATGVAAESTTVEIRRDVAGSLYRALIRVYNATDLAARDSVVDIYRVHTLGNPPLRKIGVGVSRGAAWGDAWRRGDRLTGDSEIDALMETWQLELLWFLEMSSLDYDLAVLESAHPLNTLALAALFRTVDGVANADPNWMGGDGNDIRASRDSASWRLEYGVGFGDCPAGCTGRAVWAFRVFDDDGVRYEGSTGRPPPPRLGISPGRPPARLPPG